MQEITYKEYIDNFTTYLQTPTPTKVLVCSNEDVCVLVSKAEYNEQYCIDNNITTYSTGHRGGIIVNFKDDISVGIINSNISVDYIIRCFLEFFKLKGLSCKYEDNDILVDGYKVIGFSRKIINNVDSIAFHISIGMNLSMINNICTKPMNKTPKGLSEFGISREEIKQFIEKTLGE